MDKVVKLIVAAVVVVVIWKLGIPWVKENFSSSSSVSVSSKSSDNTCVSRAQRASEAWSNGIGRFMNPPVDASAWSDFKSDVDSKISSAESECGCTAESCAKARTALGELRSIVNDFDSAVRNGGGPPGDVVQRQETVDNRINEAEELMKAGK